MPLHERLDLKHWIEKVPLAKCSPSRLDAYCDPTITSPGQIALVEQIRRVAVENGGVLGRAVPTDVMVWNLGDAARRDVTKIGGVPFWPAKEPWPTRAADGQPYTFVGQICFADSRKLVPSLPGDILVLLSGTTDFQHWSFHWFRRTTKRLLPPEDCPPPEWPIQPCHAVLHRTSDYPDASYDLFDQYPFPLDLWAKQFKDTSKIGGCWEMSGELPDPNEESDPHWKKVYQKAWRQARRAKREFIAQLYSVSAVSAPWPFTNIATNGELRKARPKKFLSIFDAGGIELFWDGKEVYSSMSSG